MTNRSKARGTAAESSVVTYFQQRGWPFACASVGLDENSNSEVGVWLDTLDVIKGRAGVRDLALPARTGRCERDAGQERARGVALGAPW